jgi:hypothetical protein
MRYVFVRSLISRGSTIFVKWNDCWKAGAEATSLDWKISVFGQIPVFRYSLLMRNRGYIDFEMLEKQCWSYLRNIKTFYTESIHISLRKNFAEHWDLHKHWDFLF